MPGLSPTPASGKVNGLSRPSRFRGRRLGMPARAPTSLVAAGLGLYGVALLFPLLLRQVSVLVAAGAVVGTALVLVGLHVRWTRTSPMAH